MTFSLASLHLSSVVVCLKKEGNRKSNTGDRVYPQNTSFGIPLEDHDAHVIMASHSNVYRPEDVSGLLTGYFEVRPFATLHYVTLHYITIGHRIYLYHTRPGGIGGFKGAPLFERFSFETAILN